jgi:phage gpG-like protein
MAALADFHDAFIIKSRGGMDAMGIQWPPLKKSTIAQRAVGPGDISSSSIIQERMKIVEQKYKKLVPIFMTAYPENRARRLARAAAERAATEATQRTKIEALGYRQVEMLRDTGRLLNSIQPGVLGANGDYSGGEDQQFDLSTGRIVIGSNVIYANAHQDGVPERNLPARPFFPVYDGQIPNEWWEDWLAGGEDALRIGFENMLIEDPRAQEMTLI